MPRRKRFDLTELRYDRAAASGPARPDPPPRHRRGEQFLKGPIPVWWLRQATSLPGRALHVGLEIWFRAGLTESRTVSVSLSRLRLAPGTPRSTASRGLRSLERAELVSVDRLPGRKPIVTLLDSRGAPPKQHDAVKDHDQEQPLG